MASVKACEVCPVYRRHARARVTTIIRKAFTSLHKPASGGLLAKWHRDAPDAADRPEPPAGSTS
jgi:hypothetical protein